MENVFVVIGRLIVTLISLFPGFGTFIVMYNVRGATIRQRWQFLPAVTATLTAGVVHFAVSFSLMRYFGILA